jgi:4'-phosphopantetheinyl transferase
VSRERVSDVPAPRQNTVRGGACDIWFADLGSLLHAIEEEERRCPRLSADEVLRAGRLSDPEQRRLWRASHIALRDILERFSGPELRNVPFASKAGGRPELAPQLFSLSDFQNLNFSLSHSGDVALIAVSRMGPVGADIEAAHARAFPEARKKKIEEIAVEIAGGAPLPGDGDRRFLQAWTRVEAMSKADGRGVLYTLSAAAAARRGDQVPMPLTFEVRDLDIGARYCAAIAGIGLPAALTVKNYIPGQSYY